jgi:hypothetical protein
MNAPRQALVVSSSCVPRAHHGAVSFANIKQNLFLPILQKAYLYLKVLASQIKKKGEQENLRKTTPYIFFLEARVYCAFFSPEIYICCLVYLKTVINCTNYTA